MDATAPRVAILIPTLGRAHRLAALIDNIREVTHTPHEIYFMTSDIDSIEVIKNKNAVHIPDVGRTDFVARTNALYHATKEPYVFTGSDDVLFHDKWLGRLLKCTPTFSVIVPSDGLNPNGTLALISRKYIEEQSGCVDVPNTIFHPGYRHGYSETELFETAKRRGVFKYCSSSLVEHLHPDAGKARIDKTYEEGWSHMDDGWRLYDSRKHLFKL